MKTALYPRSMVANSLVSVISDKIVKDKGFF